MFGSRTIGPSPLSTWPSSPGMVAMTARFDRSAAARLHHEATDAGVAGSEAVVIDQVLPYRDRITPEPQGLHDDVVERRAGARTG